MSVFTDHTNLNKAASRLARAQARFDAVVKQLSLIMKPLKDELDAANAEFKTIVIQTAKDEESGITIDLDGLLNAARQQQVAAEAAAAQTQAAQGPTA